MGISTVDQRGPSAAALRTRSSAAFRPLPTCALPPRTRRRIPAAEAAMNLTGRWSLVVGRAMFFVLVCTIPLHAQEPPQINAPPSVASLFTNLPGDFAHLFTAG